MSKCGASMSTTLPLPSSPHWAPTTTTFFISALKTRIRVSGLQNPVHWSMLAQRICAETNLQAHDAMSCACLFECLVLLRLRGGSKSAVNHAGDVVFRGRTYDPLRLGAAFEQDQSRNAFYAAALSRRIIVVYVQLHDFGLALILFSYLFNGRCE